MACEVPNPATNSASTRADARCLPSCFIIAPLRLYVVISCRHAECEQAGVHYSKCVNAINRENRDYSKCVNAINRENRAMILRDLRLSPRGRGDSDQLRSDEPASHATLLYRSGRISPCRPVC